MNTNVDQLKAWFKALQENRKEIARILNYSSTRGFKASVVEKYSEQAHFIYELLQNADDAKATEATFELRHNELIFRHNGTVHFTLSQPDTSEDQKVEDRDRLAGKLGHINSICSVGSSSKPDEKSNAIGKFGVGFKAVFQYTNTPHIYDPNFKFKIENFIVPYLIDFDFPSRKAEETLFRFPFDHPDMPSEKAYYDIEEKLKSLIHPTLFLNNLKNVNWNSETENGKYYKEIQKSDDFRNIDYDVIKLYHQIRNESKEQKLYLFKRFIDNSLQTYSVGFFVEDDKLTPVHYKAFCFFPTKETTHLNFIIHAPFLLTDSRETIKHGEQHNIEMIESLAELAAQSLIVLRNDNLIVDSTIGEIIPYKRADFYEEDYWGGEEELFFAPFYDKMKNRLMTGRFLLSADGYVGKENAYWAQDNPIMGLFSDKQLKLLTENDDARWVFRSYVRNQSSGELRDYIDKCINHSFEMRPILNLITAELVEQQDDEWLHKLYAYLAKNFAYWEDVLKTKPIFLNESRSAVSAYVSDKGVLHNVLFFPSEYVDVDDKTINSDLLNNAVSKGFFKTIGIKEADLKDEIYNRIFEQYKTDEGIDTKPHFELFFKYYKEECPREEQDKYIELLKDKAFVRFYNEGDDVIYRGVANEIYYPTPELKLYFENNDSIKFLDKEFYLDLVDKNDHDILHEFLEKLGVARKPRVVDKKIYIAPGITSLTDFDGLPLVVDDKDYAGLGALDQIIEGCKTALDNINQEKSFVLWDLIKQIDISTLQGTNTYHWYKYRYQYFESTTVTAIKTKKWLINKDGEFVAPYEITIEELDDRYEQDSYEAERLISNLNFIPLIVLTEDEKKAQIVEGRTLDEIQEALRMLDAKKEKEKQAEAAKETTEVTQKQSFKESRNTLDTIEDFIQKMDRTPPPTVDNDKVTEQTKEELIEIDNNKEFEQAVEELKSKYNVIEDRINLKDKINESKKYSYNWFSYYIQLLITYTEKQDVEKQKTISFQEIEPYKSDNKYFILKGASNYISPEIENAEDFKITLAFRNKREHIKVESVSKKGQDLLVYCPESMPAATLSHLSDVQKVDIKFNPVIDLLDRLYRAFSNENNVDNWEDFEEAFPPFHYIYGPPGTGKTTTLCENIHKVIKDNSNAKILVLAPTNKAADVVSEKLIQIDISTAVRRLSHPTDPTLDEFIYLDVLDSDVMENINVLASTIHRLPYFEIAGEGLLFQYDWDYVIFDESSMTGLHYIVFAIMSLYKNNPNTEFIVSGDPKQIPPVLEVNDKLLEEIDFQEENIYKMIKLDSFKPEEQIIRDIDSIENLTKQYRSVHPIGQLYSEFSYSNLLSHNRLEKTNDTKKQLPEKFQKLISSDVTFIDIPLDRDNSIYGVKTLFYSSYHIYSAILVAEMIKYFDLVNDTDEEWTIGLVSPYKAQAVLLSKLIASYGLSEKISVLADTVHGFQGDECDIVFFVCNPNGYRYSGNKRALLSKEYIYNVAISRARDYLIVLHPFNNISNNRYINQIVTSYNSNFGNIPIVQSHKIQEILFDNPTFIESNSFISGHDNVNVFGITDMKYFIKAGESAIDIQLRDLESNSDSGDAVLEPSTTNAIIETHNEAEEIYRPTDTKLRGVKVLGKIDLKDDYKMR